jgi:hypothetical protein
MNNRYKILFIAEVLHEFYKNKQCNDFKIVPSEQTRKLLGNYRLLYKMVQNKLVILIKVNDDGADIDKPFITINPLHKFVFYLELMRPVFMSYTNFNTDELSSKRFWFSNINQNKSTVLIDGNNVDFYNLSASIDNYANAATYNPGDFADDTTGEIFEAIQQTSGNNTTQPSAFWISRDKYQFVSAKDMCVFVTRINRYKLSASNVNFTVQVFGLDTATNQFTALVFSQTITSTLATNEVSLNLDTLPEGKYRMIINTDEFNIYLDDTAVYQSYFGVIEIFNHLPNGNDFALLDAAGKIKDTIVALVPQWLNFSIRFANRLAYWKYISRYKGVTSIDGGAAYDFNRTPALPAPADFFTSDKPIPLKEVPFEFKLVLNNPVSPDPPLAPNPDANLSGMQTRDGPDYYCNIYLNY